MRLGVHTRKYRYLDTTHKFIYFPKFFIKEKRAWMTQKNLSGYPGPPYRYSALSRWVGACVSFLLLCLKLSLRCLFSPHYVKVVSRRLPRKSLFTSPTLLKSLSGDAEVAGTVRYCLAMRVKRGNSLPSISHPPPSVKVWQLQEVGNGRLCILANALTPSLSSKEVNEEKRLWEAYVKVKGSQWGSNTLECIVPPRRHVHAKICTQMVHLSNSCCEDILRQY